MGVFTVEDTLPLRHRIPRLPGRHRLELQRRRSEGDVHQPRDRWNGLRRGDSLG